MLGGRHVGAPAASALWPACAGRQQSGRVPAAVPVVPGRVRSHEPRGVRLHAAHPPGMPGA